VGGLGVRRGVGNPKSGNLGGKKTSYSTGREIIVEPREGAAAADGKQSLEVRTKRYSCSGREQHAKKEGGAHRCRGDRRGARHSDRFGPGRFSDADAGKDRRDRGTSTIRYEYAYRCGWGPHWVAKKGGGASPAAPTVIYSLSPPRTYTNRLLGSSQE